MLTAIPGGPTAAPLNTRERRARPRDGARALCDCSCLRPPGIKAAREQLNIAPQAGQGRAQLVADDAQELVLATIERTQRLFVGARFLALPLQPRILQERELLAQDLHQQQAEAYRERAEPGELADADAEAC